MLFVRVTIFARLITKQIFMKKTKYLIFDRLEGNCFEKWRNIEKQYSPRIGSLFDFNFKTKQKIQFLQAMLAIPIWFPFKK